MPGQKRGCVRAFGIEKATSMKRCSNCGNLFPEEGTFCPACGSTSATVMLNANEQQAFDPNPPAPPAGPMGQAGAPGPVYGEYQQPPMGQPMGQQPMGQPMGVQPAPKKKSAAPIIIGIVLAIVVLLIVLIVVMAVNGKKTVIPDEPQDTGSEVTEEAAPAVAFTKGEIRDGYYYNEWADVMFPLPEGYPEAGQDVYDDLESTMIKYGFIGDRENGSGRFMVEFVLNYAISFNSDTEEGIMQEFIDELNDGDEFTAYDKGEIHTKTIGGKQYTGVIYTLPDTGVDMKLYLRTIDKHVFILWTIGPEEEGDAFLASVTACDPAAADADN